MICAKCGNLLERRLVYRNNQIIAEDYCTEDGTIVPISDENFHQELVIKENIRAVGYQLHDKNELIEFVSVIPCHYIPNLECNTCRGYKIQRFIYQEKTYYLCRGCHELSVAAVESNSK